MEKRNGRESIDYMLDSTKRPKNGPIENMKLGFQSGVERLRQSVAGAASALGRKGSQFQTDAEQERIHHKTRADILDRYRGRDEAAKRMVTKEKPLFTVGGHKFRVPAIPYSPGSIASAAVNSAPEVINPLAKIKKVGKVLDVVYHGLRGYAPDHDKKKALLSAFGHVAGEKAEDLLTHGKGLIGNVSGSVAEQSGSNMVDAWQASKK